MELIDKYVWYQEGPGVRKNQYTSSGVKLLNVANLVEEKIDLSTSSRYISEDEANGRYSHFLVDEGDLIIASSGIQVSYFEKKMGIAEKQHLPLCMNTSTIRFKVLDKNIMDIRYFMYFLKSNLFKNQIRRLITGSAQLNFGPSHLKKIKIEVPELKKQQEIVKKLDKVKKIINIRLNQIIELKELIKSQFVEMFGEPLISNNYGRITLDKLIRVSQGLQIPIGKRKNEKGNNRYKYITIQYLNGSKKEEYIENPNDRVICSKDDVLMTRTGNTGQVITNVEGVFHNNFFKMDYDRKRINKEFLIKYFENESIYKDIIRRATTSTIPDLSHSQFYKMSIDLPPLPIQNQFSEIVKQIDKQKFEIEKSLKETQELYESLMEKYFG